MIGMDQKIQVHINEISEKAKNLIAQLTELKAENDKLKQQVNEVSQKLELSKRNLSEAKAENMELENRVESSKQSVIDFSSDSAKDKNKEIDQLVREIENCIDQLSR